MADIVQEMLQLALGDGARSSKFEAYINFSASIMKPDDTDVYLNIKTSQFPGKTHEPIDLKYKGRSIPIRGQVKYDNTWTCSFYLTEGHELKIAFEDWIESLDQTQNMDYELNENVIAGQKTHYTSDLMLAQMDFTGDGQTSVYTMHNAFPKSVSAVEVDYSSVGSILEFTVEFSYSHFTSVRVGGLKGSAKTLLGEEDLGGWGNLGKSLKNVANKLITSINDEILDTQDLLELKNKDALKKKVKSLDPFGAAAAITNTASNMTGATQRNVSKVFGKARDVYGSTFDSIGGSPRTVEPMNKNTGGAPASSGSGGSSNTIIGG